jgi:two-component system, NtrC family, sensor kinase
MVKSEPLSAATSLAKNAKILWIGVDENEMPVTNADLRSRTQFTDETQFAKLKVRDEIGAVVLSVNKQTSKMAANTIEKLLKLDMPKILVINGKTKRDVVFELTSAIPFSSILVEPLNESEINALFFDEKNLGEKDDGEAQVQRARDMVAWVKVLSAAIDIQSALRAFRNEIRSFSAVKEPLLAFVNARNEPTMMFFQGAQIIDRKVSSAWPQQIKIRINDTNDSLYLANIFGRPFAKLLAVPLHLRYLSSEHNLKVGAVLFFEHGLSERESNAFMHFIEDRLQPFTIAIDRLLVEQYLKDVSRLWERTFDGLQDPVAIFDSENNILRANRAFAENLIDVRASELMNEKIRHREHDYEVHSYPITFGLSSRPTNIINHYFDVTLANRLKKQMIQSEKMAALGHLAGNIAHELNNPLTGVRSLAQILVSQTEKGATLQNDLIEVEKAAQRCQDVIRNLLEFSSGGFEKRQVNIALSEIVRKTLPLIKTQTSRFEVETDFAEGNDTVFVEPHLLQHVVFNLIKNACQAMSEKGVLTLKTYSQNIDGVQFAIFSVRDTGCGVDPQVQKQIFDFFFTTKTPGQGTGLGLSMSKNIVERFGGYIKLQSEVNKGSEFSVWLPVASTSMISS